MMSAPRQLDSRIEIVTPENIAFHYVLAGPFRRLPAYLLDCLIRLLVLLGLGMVGMLAGIGGLGGFGVALFLVGWFVLAWFYGGLFETFWNGQTPGKRVFGLRVLSIDGLPINALQAVLRNVLRDVDALPMAAGSGAVGLPLYMLGLVTMAANDRYQRLGDLAAGTIVVVERRGGLAGLAQIGHAEVIALAEQIPVNFQAPRSLAHALSMYVGRRGRFSPARRYELAAALAEPMIERLRLPAETNPDLLLCALYYRTFIDDRPALAGGKLTGRPLAEAGTG